LPHQINPKLTLSAGYVLNSTWDLQQMVDQNLFPPTYDASGMPIFPTARPNSSVGQLLVNESSAHSSYDGFLVTANLQLPHRSQLFANYTLSRTRDNNSNLGPFTRVSALNPFNLSADGAYSSFDVRNSFNLSAITILYRWPGALCPRYQSLWKRAPGAIHSSHHRILGLDAPRLRLLPVRFDPQFCCLLH
jgi:hypothetical protein